MEITYEEFINNILETRGRFACGEGYHERHHILPKCMGGGNEEENLIDLYAREHFEAHRLLALENPENDKLALAWFRMSHGKNQDRITHIVTMEEYEESRKALSIAKKDKHRSENERKKISDALKGKRVSEETRKKMRNANLGDKNPNYGKRTPSGVRKKLSKLLKGTHRSEETRKKMRESKVRQVVQYDLNKNLIKIWLSAKQVTDKLGINNSSISMCCSSKRKTAGGYQWKYLYDQTKKDGTIISGAITLGLITEEEALRMLEEQKETEGESIDEIR